MSGDLPGSTDDRQILAEIAARRMDAGAVGSVLAGLKAEPLGFVRERG